MLKCRLCKGPRHRVRGRFARPSEDPCSPALCPYTQTFEYRHFKAMFYEELERLALPSSLYRSFTSSRFLGAVPEPRA